MSAPKKSEPADGQGVLSKLPRTRPQRSSPRRAAARKATATASAATTPKRTRRPPKGTASTTATGEPAPRQGFECEGERASGPVQPPGGTELVAGAAELIGELAKAGFSTGERLFKDMLARLPLS
jgi:hypothetical protein